MKISAIISEYNPLHNGHVYHINKTKEITNSDAIICVMSGNYVQRGLPSMVDKWNRTKAVLECGIDLVLELPVLYSLSSAEFFAHGAVSLLNSLGTVDSLCFGSEIGDLNLIIKVANTLVKEPEDFKLQLKRYLDQGHVYPKARGLALFDFLSKNDSENSDNLMEHLSSSNNILGIEYCKSLLKLDSKIKPYTVKREGSAYNDRSLSTIFSSATSIRKYIKDCNSIVELQKHMPSKSYELIKKLKDNDYTFVFDEQLLPFIKYKYFSQKESLKNLPDISEGLHNRIFKNLLISNNYNELIENIKTKRYTYTRINRILCQYFVGFDSFNTKELRSQPSPYCRVLGFNETGKKVLKQIKNNSSIPLLTKLPKNINETMKLDIKATETYSLLNKFISPNSDYLISPIIID
ncbi:nucleotidyltransferase [Clostridium swellfunianum]|uniref:nucleotidyltransferase n=1 Tax=Clostridium swellfunianum TaxID=1367462 RepID=UPI0020304EFD|nr:nucleotidyltransferase [Clostridium swellfunianum]MCM0648711.1 nucleotidyltransferase [Clostridium swellfunianum]